MAGSRRAVIDIGTNSVKLLVAEVEGSVVRPLLEQGCQTRLGQGFYPQRTLQPEAIQRTIPVVVDYVRCAASNGAERVRLIATSVVREADNHHQLLELLARRISAPVEIISGEEEARLAFSGVTSDPRWAGRPLLVAEVGGGSTQVIGRQPDGQIQVRSYPVGSVRLYEWLTPADPPSPQDFSRCQEWLDQHLARPLQPDLANLSLPLGTDCVATGGTGSVLAMMQLGLTRFDRGRIEQVRMRHAEMRARLQQLWEMPLLQRQQVPGLPPERADVILTGLAIYERLLREARLETLCVSTRGVRFGALLSGAAGAP